MAIRRASWTAAATMAPIGLAIDSDRCGAAGSTRPVDAVTANNEQGDVIVGASTPA